MRVLWDLFVNRAAERAYTTTGIRLALGGANTPGQCQIGIVPGRAVAVARRLSHMY